MPVEESKKDDDDVDYSELSQLSVEDLLAKIDELPYDISNMTLNDLVKSSNK